MISVKSALTGVDLYSVNELRRSYVAITINILLRCKVVFEELVDWPWNPCRRHLVQNSSRHPVEEASSSTELIDSLTGLTDPGYSMLALGDCTLLLGVKKSLTYIQGGGCRGSYCAGESTGYHMGLGVVLAIMIYVVLAFFIHNKMQALERDVHTKLGCIWAVERFGSFCLKNSPSTSDTVLMCARVHLHSLLDHWYRMVEETGNMKQKKNTPSVTESVIFEKHSIFF